MPLHASSASLVSLPKSSTLSSSSYLHPCLAEVQPHGELLPGEHVGVLGLLETPLQLMELKGCESCPGSPNFPRFVSVQVIFLVKVFISTFVLVPLVKTLINGFIKFG